MAAAQAASVATATAGSERAAAGAAQAPERMLLILELAGSEPAATAAALGVSLYEAQQLLRRGGAHLHRVLTLDEAPFEAERLAGLGVRVHAIPEAETRVPPLLTLGGCFRGGALELRGEKERLVVEGAGLRLVVRGPITREYQARPPKKLTALASLESGYRFHLHRRAEATPIEIDPWAFEFDSDAEAGRSSLLLISSWVAALAVGVPIDDGFRRLSPALAPEAQAERSALSTAALVQRKTDTKAASLVLDNLRQFRFYSAWRAAALRRSDG